MTATRRKSYLIQDPYDDDAVRFIRTLFTYFGLRPICFYSDRKQRYYGEHRYPILTSERIEASYDVDLANLTPFADEVRRRYEVLGVIPYREDTVEVAADLCALFDFGWNSAETLRRFRDKHALKTFLRQSNATLRVPQSRLVRRVEDVWAAPVPSRFVIKPNHGFGNRHIGIFDATARDGVAAHLAREPSASWVLEEYIGGPEFHINGQVRSNGDIVLLGMLEYLRTEANGCPTVYRAERQCRTDHALFEPIAAYARKLVRTSGLRRCPFHMEVKVDEHGPCLIDIGARFPSEGGGNMLSRFHPSRPDVYAIAAHDYLGENTFAAKPIDWRYYNQNTTLLVYGISTEEGVIHALDGLDAVEALPEFVNWPVKPRVGDRLYRTIDLGSKSYVVELSHRGDERNSDRLIELVQAEVKINATSSYPARLRARTLDVLRRALPKLRWMTHGALRTG